MASTTRSIRRRKKIRSDIAWIIGIGALFAVITAARWVRAHPLPAVLIAGLLGLAAVAWAARRGRRLIRARRSRRTAPTSIRAYQAASPGQFEQHVAALHRRDGCRDVEVVGGANDRAADVLATYPNGRRVLVQCKRYGPDKKVDADTVYAVNGTYRDWHGRDEATIVTTSDFTPSAREFVDRVGIRLVNGRNLARWASGTGPAPWR
ncbi:restriction endonuclease [Streptomyces sp. NPDC054933]